MIRITSFFLFACISLPSFAQSKIPTTEALLIKEAKLITDKTGDKIWPGISKTSFAIILVTDSLEFLINHPYPSTDFKKVYRDSILQTDIYARPRTFSKNLLATFPAVNGLSCMVVGTPANTGRSLTDWMITLLHEHFHQYVNSQPGYYASVNALNLSGGDETGMWMLNYPFPYDSAIVIQQYEKYTTALINAVNSIGKATFNTNLNTFIKEKATFKALLKSEDYRYFSFQLWQEGLAAYTEYKFLESLTAYKISPAVAQLKGFTSLQDYRNKYYKNRMQDLQQLKLATDQRICIYAVGFAEGILLDTVNKKWRRQYLTDKFATDNYFRSK